MSLGIMRTFISIPVGEKFPAEWAF